MLMPKDLEKLIFNFELTPHVANQSKTRAQRAQSQYPPYLIGRSKAKTELVGNNKSICMNHQN